MDKTLSSNKKPIFEQIKQTDTKKNEYWGARQLAKTLGYREFRNFQTVIQKAKQACNNSGQQIHHHFVHFHEEIGHGKGAKQQYTSVKLSRYACYLIVQNTNPKKYEAYNNS